MTLVYDTIGTAANETILGTANGDVINGGAGNDSIYGDDGNDTLEGALGEDTVKGGNGNDLIRGNKDKDQLYGDAGNDILEGKDGADYLDGGTGGDHIDAGDGNDYVVGGGGNDTVNGGSGDDTFEGGLGDDSINGGSGTDLIDYRGFSNQYQLVFNIPEGTVVRLGQDDTDDTISSIERIIASQGNDTIYDNTTLNYIDGHGGIDQLSYENSSIQLNINLSNNQVLDANNVFKAFIHNIESIRGTSHADTITGSDSADTLFGLDGNDHLSGGTGDDYLDGGLGDDIINGGNGSDSIIGAEGNDKLYGNAGSDTIHGSDGDDIIVGGSGSSGSFTKTIVYDNTSISRDFNGDSISGGDGLDVIWGDEEMETNSVTSKQEYSGGSGDGDYIEGGGQNDQIHGGTGDDYLQGNHGVDSLYGEDGEDTVRGGQGNDQLYGGAGNDLLLGDKGHDYLYGGLGADVIYGDLHSNGDVSPDEGTDKVWGDVTLSGGDDNYDTVIAGGKDTIYGGNHNDTIFAGGGNDSINGNGGADFIRGGGGFDRIEGGKQNDTIIGGAGHFEGNDTKAADESYTVTENYFNFAVHTEDNVNVVKFVSQGDTRTFSGDLIYGRLGTDILWGDTAQDDEDAENNDTLGDNDLIEGGAENDTIHGGAGNDFIHGNEGNDLLFGEIGDDTIRGGQDVDSIYGGSGSDIIIGDKSGDLLVGGDGADLIYGDRTKFADDGNGGIKTVNLDGETTDDDGADTIWGDDKGQSATDTVGGNDTLYGGGKADTVHGGGGNDFLQGNGGQDHLFGDFGNDSIHGGKNHDAINGGLGRDTIKGDLGGDFLFGDDQSNHNFTKAHELMLIHQANNTAGVKSDLLFFDTVNEGTVFTGADSIDNGDSIEGGNDNDVIFGGYGDDTIDGQSGYDLLYGGAGNDLIKGGNNKDIIRGGLGNDTIDGQNGYDLISGGEGDDSILGGEHADFLQGNEGNDYINGNGGNDTVRGGKGNDTIEGGKDNDTFYGDLGDDYLYGNKGDDYLDGGSGNDTFDGGTGNDWFVLKKGEGDVVIKDLEAINKLEKIDLRDFPEIASFDDLTITQAGSDTEITFGDQKITLEDVTASDINSSNFIGSWSSTKTMNLFKVGGLLDGFNRNDAIATKGVNSKQVDGKLYEYFVQGFDTSNFGNEDLTKVHNIIDISSFDLPDSMTIDNIMSFITENTDGDAVIDAGAGRTITIEGIAKADLSAANFRIEETNYQSDINNLLSDWDTGFTVVGDEEVPNQTINQNVTASEDYIDTSAGHKISYVTTASQIEYSNLTTQFKGLETKQFVVDQALADGEMQIVEGFDANNITHVINLQDDGIKTMQDLGFQQIGSDAIVNIGDGKSVVLKDTQVEELSADSFVGVEDNTPKLLASYKVFRVASDKVDTSNLEPVNGQEVDATQGQTYVVDTVNTENNNIILLDGFNKTSLSGNDVYMDGDYAVASLGNNNFLKVKGIDTSKLLSYVNDEQILKNVIDPDKTYITTDSGSVLHNVMNNDNGYTNIMAGQMDLMQAKDNISSDANDKSWLQNITGQSSNISTLATAAQNFWNASSGNLVSSIMSQGDVVLDEGGKILGRIARNVDMTFIEIYDSVTETYSKTIKGLNYNLSFSYENTTTTTYKGVLLEITETLVDTGLASRIGTYGKVADILGRAAPGIDFAGNVITNAGENGGLSTDVVVGSIAQTGSATYIAAQLGKLAWNIGSNGNPWVVGAKFVVAGLASTGIHEYEIYNGNSIKSLSYDGTQLLLDANEQAWDYGIEKTKTGFSALKNKLNSEYNDIFKAKEVEIGRLQGENENSFLGGDNNADLGDITSGEFTSGSGFSSTVLSERIEEAANNISSSSTDSNQTPIPDSFTYAMNSTSSGGYFYNDGEVFQKFSNSSGDLSQHIGNLADYIFGGGDPTKVVGYTPPTPVMNPGFFSDKPVGDYYTIDGVLHIVKLDVDGSTKVGVATTFAEQLAAGDESENQDIEHLQTNKTTGEVDTVTSTVDVLIDATGDAIESFIASFVTNSVKQVLLGLAQGQDFDDIVNNLDENLEGLAESTLLDKSAELAFNVFSGEEFTTAMEGALTGSGTGTIGSAVTAVLLDNLGTSQLSNGFSTLTGNIVADVIFQTAVAAINGDLKVEDLDSTLGSIAISAGLSYATGNALAGLALSYGSLATTVGPPVASASLIGGVSGTIATSSGAVSATAANVVGTTIVNALGGNAALMSSAMLSGIGTLGIGLAAGIIMMAATGAFDHQPKWSVFTGTDFADVMFHDGDHQETDLMGGDDLLFGWEGWNLVFGGEGNDTLIGGNGTYNNRPDELFGEEGDDYLAGQANGDDLMGGGGSDYANGNAGIDVIFGGDDPNEIGKYVRNGHGNTGVDTGDTLHGGQGNDLINGQGGDDLIYGDKGDDIMTGGAGRDTFVITNNNDSNEYDIIHDFDVAKDALDFTSFGNNVGVIIQNVTDGRVWEYVTESTGINRGAPVIESTASGTLITISLTGQQIFLIGVDASAFTAALGDQIDPDAASGVNNYTIVTGIAGNEDFSAQILQADIVEDTVTGSQTVTTVIDNTQDEVVITGEADDVIDFAAATGDNYINGNAGHDSILGGSGNDTIVAGAGDDTIDAGDGNDLVYAEGGNDVITGGSGDDTLHGGADNDSLNGGDDDDVLISGGGTDTLSGGTGDNKFVITNGSIATITDFNAGDIIDLTDYNDVVTSYQYIIDNTTDDGNGNSVIDLGNGELVTINGILPTNLTIDDFAGYAGLNPVIGTANADTLSSTAADDAIYGLAGDDLINAGVGGDVIDGGDGYDTVSYAGSNEAVRVELKTGAVSGGDAIGDAIVNIENIIGSNYDDTLAGDSVANIINAGTGSDKITTYGGNDTISGGTGTDSFIISKDASSAVTITDFSSDEVIDLTAFDSVVQSFEHLTENITEVNGDSIIDLGDGQTLILTGVTAATLGATNFTGNAGIATVFGTVNGDNLNGSNNNDVIYGGNERDVIDGNSGDDRLYGEHGQDILSGGKGNDTLVGGTEYDYMSGGTGADVYIWGSADGNDVIVESLDIDTNIDKIIVSDAAEADVEVNSSGYDLILTITSTGNTLTVKDHYKSHSDDTSSTRIEQIEFTDTTVTLTTDYSIDGDGTDNTITGTSNTDIIDGKAGDDLISGTDGNDVIIDGTGSDTLTGGTGDDLFVITQSSGDTDEITDLIIGDDKINLDDFALIQHYGGIIIHDRGTYSEINYNNGQHIIKVDGILANQISKEMFDGRAGLNFVTNGTDGVDIIAGTEDADYISTGNNDDIIYGYGGDDYLDAGEDDNYIDGGTGNDHILAGGGDDRLYGVEGNDTLDGGSGNDSIYGGDQNDSVIAGAGNDYVDSGAGDDIISGDGGNDTIYGNNGLNTIDGGSGDDYIIGGLSDDSINGSLGNDHIDGNIGDDTMSGDAGADTMFGMGGNDLLYGNDGADHIEGNLGNDTLSGGAGDDSLYGSAGDDSLNGGDGDDALVGGEGSDTLTGGSGLDVFVFDSISGSDFITDFSITDGDKIQIDGGVYISTANAADNVTYANGNAYIAIGSNDTLTVTGISEGSLTDNEFLVTQ